MKRHGSLILMAVAAVLLLTGFTWSYNSLERMLGARDAEMARQTADQLAAGRAARATIAAVRADAQMAREQAQRLTRRADSLGGEAEAAGAIAEGLRGQLAGVTTLEDCQRVALEMDASRALEVGRLREALAARVEETQLLRRSQELLDGALAKADTAITGLTGQLEREAGRCRGLKVLFVCLPPGPLAVAAGATGAVATALIAASVR